MRKKSRASAFALAVILLCVVAISLFWTPPTRSQKTEQVTPTSEDSTVAESETPEPQTSSVHEGSGSSLAMPPSPPEAQDEPARTQRILRVILEGVPEGAAQPATITLTGVDHSRESWPSHFRASWPGQGVISEVDLDPFFRLVQSQPHIWDLEVDELEVTVSHPLYQKASARAPLVAGETLPNGQTLYEVRILLIPGMAHEFWPELTLHVRDAETREHLDAVELRMVPTAFMGLGQIPGDDSIFTRLGSGLSSPIRLMGGRETGSSEEHLSGIAVSPEGDQAPHLMELVQPEETARGVHVYVGAPDYSWSVVTIDVATDAEREVLLEPSAALRLQFSNVQLERYAKLDTEATLWVDELAATTERRAWIGQVDEDLESSGLYLPAVKPGDYAISVRLGSGWSEPPVLALEVVSLRAGETHDLLLELGDPPPPMPVATLAGTLTLPRFEGIEETRLQLYSETSGFRQPEREFSLAEFQSSEGGGASWSFRIDDLPVGTYQLQLVPVLTSWMVEVPRQGREDLQLKVSELAEVIVETVDAQSGLRVPIEELFFRREESAPETFHNIWAVMERDALGRFKLQTLPGKVSVWTHSIPEGFDYGPASHEFRLEAGEQTLRFELNRSYSIKFEILEDEVPLSRMDPLWSELGRELLGSIRPVGHDGRLISLGRYEREKRVELSRAGVYEIRFDEWGAGEYRAIPTQRVEVRPGEPAEVVIELLRL